MAEPPFSRRTFVAGAAGMAALAAAALGAGCATFSDTSEETGSSALEPTAKETSEDATTAEATPATERASGTLAFALGMARGDLTPWGPDAPSAACINRPVLEGLYELDPATFATRPALAKGAPEKTNENVYEVTLREYALFSDGSEMSARDVVRSFRRALENADGSLASLLSFIADIQATGEDTVAIVTKTPMEGLLESRLALVKIVPTGTLRKRLAAGAIGSGPWKFAAISDKRATYTPNTFYTGDMPALVERMTCSFITSQQERADALATGDIQIAADAPWEFAEVEAEVEAEEAQAEAETEDAGAGTSDAEAEGDAVTAEDAAELGSKDATEVEIETQSEPGYNPVLIVFNTLRKPFDDVRVRRALLTAINANDLIRDPCSGQARAALCFVDETCADFQRAARIYRCDTNEARKLLERAGIEDLSITLDIAEEDGLAAIAALIAADWEALGIQVEVASSERAVLREERTDTAQDVQPFSVALTTADPGVFGNDADLLLSWFFDSDTWMAKRTGWKDSDAAEQIRELITSARAAEIDERAAIYKQAFDIIADEAPLYPIIFRNRITAWRPSAVEGLIPIGVAGLDLSNATLA